MKFFSLIFFFVFIIMASSTSLRKDDEPCLIPYIYRPVCGSDGVTYSNSYALECERKKNPDLKLAHEGPC
ncbi:Serine protease inhibitor dipetalogastin [Armadillidium nasatum]|uniref:Serine protease inhibitor dipetalogastin n=1 Tax=Armadillidium nasatum TaxID=96803 RepID=A0A5N5SLY6_9CRUS|nr:Serine protease inhibitor dipetalogastin [Armadillidium nasatum]